MDTPMLAERGWCMAGSSKGKSTDTSGCREERNGQESSSKKPQGRTQEACYMSNKLDCCKYTRWPTNQHLGYILHIVMISIRAKNSNMASGVHHRSLLVLRGGILWFGTLNDFENSPQHPNHLDPVSESWRQKVIFGEKNQSSFVMQLLLYFPKDCLYSYPPLSAIELTELCSVLLTLIAWQMNAPHTFIPQWNYIWRHFCSEPEDLSRFGSFTKHFHL